jgi:hypothetical protein
LNVEIHGAVPGEVPYFHNHALGKHGSVYVCVQPGRWHILEVAMEALLIPEILLVFLMVVLMVAEPLNHITDVGNLEKTSSKIPTTSLPSETCLTKIVWIRATGNKLFLV